MNPDTRRQTPVPAPTVLAIAASISLPRPRRPPSAPRPAAPGRTAQSRGPRATQQARGSSGVSATYRHHRECSSVSAARLELTALWVKRDEHVLIRRVGEACGVKRRGVIGTLA